MANPLQALIFDSAFNVYKGVIIYVRLVNGTVHTGMRIKIMNSGRTYEVKEIGIFKPGVDTMMICDQITGLPVKPRHLAREKNCVLAGAGTNLKDCLAILKLVADHLKNSVLVAQSGWRVWLCHR